MALYIKNEEVEQLARTLAARRRVSLTEAIRLALRAMTESEAQDTEALIASRIETATRIARRVSAMPELQAGVSAPGGKA